MGATQVRRKTKPTAYELDIDSEDDVYVTRTPTSTRRYMPPAQHDTLEEPVTQPGPFIQRRASMKPHTSSGTASKAITPPLKTTMQRASQRFPLTALVLGMLVMGTLVVGLTYFGSWWKIHQDDTQYGRPRTYQVDAVVGHGDSSANKTHFIFMNLNRHVTIIEFPGGDSTHPHVYTGPTLFGDGQDLTPVTGTIRDVNGDGKPDLIVYIQDQRFVLINTGSTFRPLQPGERVSV